MNREKKTIEMAIGFATGRKNFKRVLNTYINNWKECGLVNAEHVKLNIFVVYDLKYNKTIASDYTDISSRLREMVQSLNFLDGEYIRNEIRDLVRDQVISPEEAAIFFGSGYAAMRNIILYAAIKQQMDYLLYLDDDEYPLAVVKNRDAALWCGQHVLKLHLQNIPDADITNGRHCGYISPIPNFQFNDTLKKSDFRAFIEAISNDIISWKSLQTIMNDGGVSYADSRVLESGLVEEVAETNNCKFISGSNLCLNLHDPCRTSPFYNPPQARGEDTFLSTCLRERKVLRLPCYTFHDGFSTYQHVLSGVMPRDLRRVPPNSQQVINRFYRACIGWVRYKPLFLHITQPESYQEQIQLMKGNLRKTLPKLSAYFQANNFMNIGKELDFYHKQVAEDYRQFSAGQEIWAKIVRHLAG